MRRDEFRGALRSCGPTPSSGRTRSTWHAQRGPFGERLAGRLHRRAGRRLHAGGARRGGLVRLWTGEIREVGVHPLGRRLHEAPAVRGAGCTRRRLYEAPAVRGEGRSGFLAGGVAAGVDRAVEAACAGGVLPHAAAGAGPVPAWPAAAWRRRSGGCGPCRGRATARPAARCSPPRMPRPDLIDEHRVIVHPVRVGGGIPLFPREERRADLARVETRTFTSGLVRLRHRVTRQAPPGPSRHSSSHKPRPRGVLPSPRCARMRCRSSPRASPTRPCPASRAAAPRQG